MVHNQQSSKGIVILKFTFSLKSSVHQGILWQRPEYEDFILKRINLEYVYIMNWHYAL